MNGDQAVALFLITVGSGFIVLMCVGLCRSVWRRWNNNLDKREAIRNAVAWKKVGVTGGGGNYKKSGGDDLNGRDVLVTINHADIEKIGDDSKLIIYFKNKEKGMGLLTSCMVRYRFISDRPPGSASL